MNSLGGIITSRVRIKILELMFADTKEKYHVRGVVRLIEEEINAIRRELLRLSEAGILRSEKRGNRVYYWAREDCPIFGDLLSLVSKSTGLGSKIIENKSKIGRLSFVMFSGGFARGEEQKKTDSVDILVVGEVVLPELAAIVRTEETRLGREINYTVMSREEFDFRKRRRDPFLLEILSGSRTMVVGDEYSLVG